MGLFLRDYCVWTRWSRNNKMSLQKRKQCGQSRAPRTTDVNSEGRGATRQGVKMALRWRWQENESSLQSCQLSRLMTSQAHDQKLILCHTALWAVIYYINKAKWCRTLLIFKELICHAGWAPEFACLMERENHLLKDVHWPSHRCYATRACT